MGWIWIWCLFREVQPKTCKKATCWRGGLLRVPRAPGHSAPPCARRRPRKNERIGWTKRTQGQWTLFPFEADIKSLHCHCLCMLVLFAIFCHCAASCQLVTSSLLRPSGQALAAEARLSRRERASSVQGRWVGLVMGPRVAVEAEILYTIIYRNEDSSTKFPDVECGE